ncbi:Uncharacterised protein [BD1-7 clade bacterium]|uniref:Shedu protein SduA C-terminal domain-containing protein n=1 Tax=BD1-7 clade bacterium TaxID=2029982 RepID=A0A5S9Q8K0_9GAMM|nr:Uncharacterised protein [BD1-7 clade bacterium]CAA0120960.1 Uncharacterised protein [BD1-7 clade bacterium]
MNDELENMDDSDHYMAFVKKLGGWLARNYWQPLYKHVRENPELLSRFPGYLLKPEKIIYYMGRTHIGVEYIGPERYSEFPKDGLVEIQIHDYSLRECNLIDEIVGFDYSDGRLKIPLSPLMEDLVLPTNAGADKLQSLGWRYASQDMFLSFNSAGVIAPENQFTRLINARFFDASEESGLKTRHIKHLDLIPCIFDDSGSDLDTFQVWLEPYRTLVESDRDATYPLPTDFKYQRLQKINRFIEFIGDLSNTEVKITQLLASEEFIFALKMRFSVTEVFPELNCAWQSEDRPAIKPDFFVVGADGYADIVEFKLPNLKGSSVVGRTNRETFSSTVNSYISQTRVYREYFDDPKNREYIKSEYGFDVYKPRRHLIIGRRWDFSSPEWRKIAADFQDVTIHTYDDLVDGIVAQFYD